MIQNRAQYDQLTVDCPGGNPRISPVEYILVYHGGVKRVQIGCAEDP